MTPETDDNVSVKSTPTQLMLGYPTLAAYMSATPETAIFRRFADLNVQTLLYYQAELVCLEARLRELEVANSNCDYSDSKSRYSRDWEWLSHQEPNGAFNDQLQLALRIRTVLKDYNELLLQQASLVLLPKPSNYDLNFLQEWLDDPKAGNFPLLGPDRNWTSATDLLSLRRRAESDTFSKWVSEKLLPPYHRYLGRFIHKKTPDQYNEVKYKDSAVLKTASMLATTLVALLIIAPVAILYKISSMEARLGVMAAFTVLFSLCITGLTNAKRGEIFAATAAFAAVQVVFIGSNVEITFSPIVRNGAIVASTL